MQLLNTASGRTFGRLHICNLMIALSLLVLHAETVTVKLCYFACLSREVLPIPLGVLRENESVLAQFRSKAAWINGSLKSKSLRM